MKLVYLTAKTYPASTADHIYVLELAKGFHAALKDDFVLVVANDLGNDLRGLPVLNVRLSSRHFKTLFYFLWLPYFILRSERDMVFFSNDPNLLMVLIFWKKVLRLRYKICSDWHMLFGGWRDRFIQRNSDRLVTTSNKLKDAIIAVSQIHKEKILAAYGGIDLGAYEHVSKNDARTRVNLPHGKKIVTYAGFFKTMGMEKGIRTMIQALPELPDEVVMLFVGGKDGEISEYREYAEGINAAGRCIFVGRKSQGELAVYEAASDILAIPYPDKPHFRDVGFPMKVYEYMAANRPVVYSQLALVEEVIAPYARGFKADDAADFSNAVLEVLGHYAVWERKAAEAAEQAKHYAWENKARAILHFIQP
ncbi:glycosyltransferase family 4 protein [Patescibacteria group bacterium]|nr:glycosyltransferase family 4 protein [Patescibacteria group bacterium]